MKNFFIWIILLAVVGYGGAKLYMHNEVGEAVDMAVLQMAPFADVEYDGVASTLSGELTVEGVRVRVNGYSDYLTIDRIGIDTPSFLSLISLSDLSSQGPDAMPEYIGFLVEGLRIPSNADYFRDLYEFSLAARAGQAELAAADECTGKYGFSPSTLSALGYANQDIDMYMVLRDEETRYSVDVEMSMADMWDVDASIEMDGNMIAEMSKGLMYQPRLRSMHIEFTDQSLNDRVASYCRSQGLSDADVIRAQVESFKYVGASSGIEFDQYIIDPYKEFLLGKSTLVVTAKPTEPVAFSQIDLYAPSDVPALLNLAAVAR
ncbi:MAG: hypothetical protein P8X81_08600 [Woeseiaceae bacterium]